MSNIKINPTMNIDTIGTNAVPYGMHLMKQTLLA